MKVRTFMAGVGMLAIAGVAAVFWAGYREHGGTAAPVSAETDAGQRVERGRYLARLGNCMGCHTAAGGQAYAGGRALDTPFGVFYGPNLTPDPRHGLGNWSADDFWRALHHGKTPDGSLLYPAFPYPSYRNVSRADADALFAYLQSLPPAAQENRPHELKFPYDQRWLVAVWRAFYFRPQSDRPDTPPEERSEAWLRGRYLVQGLAHCAECHTPRNRLGAMALSAGLAGSRIEGQSWYAPPLTGDQATGLGAWTEQDIVELLKTGVSRRSHAAGPMAEAILQGFQHAQESDLRAMAVYLKSLPAAGTDKAALAEPASQAVMQNGGRLYRQYCAQCHQDDGKGNVPAWPPLAGNISVMAAAPDNAIHMVLSGGFPPSTAGNPEPHGMPPFGQMLNDQDVAAVVSYIRQSWDNQASAVSLPEVRKVREAAR
ncbi:Alcohol dehydrogenase cytochrome c subunit precursor [Pigmentiphaga humi]|uniref:Alcohol dehydrogenase cytochrome c subunit n=1 Tax=Pigmentiphaga humi TaxID=2478468 RepID=A0A3P4B6J5_9BURK|nr:cytochrome c [Pigmentiphaga humi]VCU70805.1 Alcohol dehydrogenase cytochrome c subunit precursor [Pigmentiphaga humi]